MGVLRRSWTLRRAVSTWTSAPVGLYDRHTSQPSWHVAAATPWSGWAAPPAPPPSALNIPYVVETTARGERGYDIFSRLLVERILCVNGPVDDNTSALVVAQLLYLDSLSQEAPIHMYINSPGGLVTAGLAIYDAMQFVRAPVSTLCVGQACSMASLLLAAGSPGLRRSLPNARIMVHQVRRRRARRRGFARARARARQGRVGAASVFARLPPALGPPRRVTSRTVV